MTAPARHIAGNLVWTAHGTVLAIWRVRPASYLHTSRAEKLKLYHATRGVLAQLRADAMLLSLTMPIDPIATAQRMVDGVDLASQPDWVTAVDATLDLLVECDLYDRARFLVAELPAAQALVGARTIAASAASRVTGVFGLPARPPAAAEARRRRQQEADYLTRLGAGPLLRRATATEVAWIYARAYRRGLFDLPLDGPDADLEHGDPHHDPDGRRFAAESHVRDGYLRGPALTVLDEAVAFEGGERGGPKRREGLRRFVQLTSAFGVGYQAFGALADMPDAFSFPDGAEWFGVDDAVDEPVDWYARLRVIPNEEARRTARRKLRQLVAQKDEYVGETAGLPTSLGNAIDALDDAQAELSSSSDPMLATTLVFSVAADTAEEADRRIARLQAVLRGGEYRLARPIGDQEALYEGSKPGNPPPRACRDFEQMLTPRQLAAGNPFAGADLGDPAGMLLGFSLDGGSARPVLIDPARGPATDRSGSIAITAALGAGKSFTLKHLAWGVLARGGQFATLDRTEHGEWVQFAQNAPGSTEVVTLTSDAAVSIDPLQIFTGDEALQFGTGFLCLLLGIGIQETEGDVLTAAIKTVLGDRRPRAASLVGVLEERAREDRGRRLGDAAELVAGRLRGRISEKLARVVFGDAPPLRLSRADSVILWTPGLKPPPREVLLSPELAKRLLGEQLLAQAMVYLAAAVMRKITFTDRSRFGAMCLDEASFLTASVEGAQLYEEGLRESRRANAAVWVAAQDVASLGEPRLRALIPIRIAGRQGSRYAAEQALELLGMDADEEHVTALQEINPDAERQPDRVGECYLRDLDGRVGFLQVVPPPVAGLTAAWDSNPRAATHRPTPLQQPISPVVAASYPRPAARTSTRNPAISPATIEPAAVAPATVVTPTTVVAPATVVAPTTAHPAAGAEATPDGRGTLLAKPLPPAWHVTAGGRGSPPRPGPR